MVLIAIKGGRGAFPARTREEKGAGLEERGMQEGESSVALCPGDSDSPSTPAQLPIRQLMRLERSGAAFPFPEAMEELSHPCPAPGITRAVKALLEPSRRSCEPHPRCQDTPERALCPDLHGGTQTSSPV